MKKIIFLVLPALAIALLMGFVLFDSRSDEVVESVVIEKPDYKDVELLLEGQKVKLADGYAETEMAPGSASKIITRYFGNELKTDLNGDGREDVAFIVTQEMGGSGTFYYAVGAVATDDGYVGTDGYLLGDRVSPQSTTVSPNPRHRNVVVFNYVDRRLDQPMTSVPSVGKSAYLKLDDIMRWGVTESDFEGEEAPPTERYSARVDRIEVVFEHWDYTSYRFTTGGGYVQEGELNTERGFGDDPDATLYVLNWRKHEGERIYFVRLRNDPTHIYNVRYDTQEIIKGSALTLEK